MSKHCSNISDCPINVFLQLVYLNWNKNHSTHCIDESLKSLVLCRRSLLSLPINHLLKKWSHSPWEISHILMSLIKFLWCLTYPSLPLYFLYTGS